MLVRYSPEPSRYWYAVYSALTPLNSDSRAIPESLLKATNITADLDAMGATEAILGAVKAKLPRYAAPWLDAAGGLLFARLGIDEVAIGEGEVKGKVVIYS